MTKNSSDISINPIIDEESGSNVYQNIKQEYRMIREEVGVIDLSFTVKLKVSGADVLDFLQEFISKDLEFLSEEQTLSCLIFEQDGTLVGEIIIYVHEDYFMLEIWPEFSQNVLSYLKRYAPDTIKIEDISDTTTILLLEGPKSWRVLQEYLPMPIQVIPFQNFSHFKYNEEPLIIARLGYTAEYGYKIIGSPEAVGNFLKEILTIEFNDIEIQQVSLNSLDICRLEVRFPDLSKELMSNQEVLELGVNWLIDFNKVFPGRDKLLKRLRAGVDKKAVCFISDNEINLQEEVVVEGETIGHVQHALYSPGVKGYVGIAFLNHDYAASGFAFSLRDGAMIKTVSSPMVQAKSLSIRME